MSLYCSSCLSICSYTRPSPFFSNAFPDIGSVGQIKKKKLKKNTRSLRTGGLVPQHHCCGDWKQQDMNPNSIWRKRMMLKVNIYIFGLTKRTI